MKKSRSLLPILAVVAMSGFLLVGCSHSSGEAATINGIAVPPVPDPVVNAATIAGIDSNNNGVRDDVERVIAITNKTRSDKNSLKISAAKKAQVALTSKNQERSNYIKYECDISSLGPEDGPFLHNLIFNTKERRLMYKNQLPPSGTVFMAGEISSDGLSIVPNSTCISDQKPYKSNE